MSACRKKGMRPKHGAPEVSISGGKRTGRSHPSSSLRRSSHDCTAVPAAGLHLLTGASLPALQHDFGPAGLVSGQPASVSPSDSSDPISPWPQHGCPVVGSGSSPLPWFFITRLLPLPFFPVCLAGPCASTRHSQVTFLVLLP